VDFKAKKAAVSMRQVPEYFGFAESFKRTRNSLSRPCPLHGGQNKTQFRVSLDKNCWNCFGTCNGGGNILDFVTRKEGCSLREAALKHGHATQNRASRLPRQRANTTNI
jgi:DNA primase